MEKIVFSLRKSKALKTLCGAALLVSGLVLVSQNVSADTWVANSPSQITIAEGDTSYQLKKGDTLWAVSQVIGIDVPTLAQLSGIDLSVGQERYLPVGYTIRWTADKSLLTLEDSTGTVQRQLEKGEDGSYSLVSPTALTSLAPNEFLQQLASQVKSISFENGVTHIELEDGISLEEFTSKYQELINKSSEVVKPAISNKEENKVSETTKSSTSNTIKEDNKTSDEVKPTKPSKDENKSTETTKPVTPSKDSSKTEQGTKPESTVETSGKDKIYFLRRINESSDMILVESNGKFGLVDAGYRNRATLDYAVDFLKNHGVKELDFVWISHYDEDHIDGIDAYSEGVVSYGNAKRNDTTLLDNFAIKHVYLPKNITGADYEKSAVNNVIRTLNERGISYSTEGNFTMGDFVMTTFNDKPFTDDELKYNKGQRLANYSSRALLIEKENYDVLLNGDIESYDEKNEAQEVYAATGTVDIYKAGHHGLATSNSEELMTTLSPKVTVVTNGVGGVPAEQKSSLSDYSPQGVYYTGSNTVSLDMTDLSDGLEVANEDTGHVYTTVVNTDTSEGTRLTQTAETAEEVSQ